VSQFAIAFSIDEDVATLRLLLEVLLLLP